MSVQRLTCGEYAHVLLPFVHEAMGAAEAPGIPCALCFRGRSTHNSGRSCRGNTNARPLGCLKAESGKSALSCPGRSAARSGALQIRDPNLGSGSAPHHDAARLALRRVRGMRVDCPSAPLVLRPHRCYIGRARLCRASGANISPGPYRSFRELSLAGSVDPDIWCPPTFVGNSGIACFNGVCGFALLCLRSSASVP
jgi:hypothetical protein